MGDWPIQKLIHYVKELPDYDRTWSKERKLKPSPTSFSSPFTTKPELFRTDTRIQLARLTNRQFRQSVTDLFSAFEGSLDLSQAEHGLKEDTIIEA